MNTEEKKRAKEIEYILEHAGAITLRDIIISNYINVCSINHRQYIKEDIINKINA